MARTRGGDDAGHALGAGLELTGLVGFGGASLAGVAAAGLQPVVSWFLFPGGTGHGGWAHTFVGMGHRGTATLCCTSD